MSNDLNDYKPICKFKAENIQTNVGVYDHLKINIEQSSKGARVTVTYDRSDHDIDEAVGRAAKLYQDTIEHLKEMNMKVDESH